jgi:capsular polysaccharide transport system permease protein
MAAERTETRDPPAGETIGTPAGVPLPGPAAGLPARAQAEGALAIAPLRPLGVLRPYAARPRILSLRLVSFLILVVLPVAAAAVYYLFIAAGQYVVEFRFGVRSVEPTPSRLGGLFFGSLASSPVVSDSYAVVQYIESRAIVDALGKTLDLTAIFSRPQADWPARLHPPVPVEELVRYWRGQVDAFYDATDHSITVKVRAFTPRDALALAQGIRAAAEQMVNHLSARARRDTLGHAQADLRHAEARLGGVLARLRQFRDREGVIDPRQTANSTEALAAAIRDALVGAKTQRAVLDRYMKADAPALKLLDARIKSLAAEERSVSGEITSKERTRARILSHVMTSYEELESERRFAETAYQHALKALDRARRDADRQQIYLATFIAPSLPEEPLYPRRLTAIGVVFLGAFAVWGIGGLLVQSIRDHL